MEARPLALPKQLSRLAATLVVGLLALAVLDALPSAQAQAALTVLHSFPANSDGYRLWSGVVLDNSGNLYGTTLQGGDLSCGSNGLGCGTVFKLSQDLAGTWTMQVIHRFTGGADGATPYGGVVLDGAGNLYGTTFSGGGGGGGNNGTVFKLSPNADGSWTETILHRFTGFTGASCKGCDGASPYAGLIFDKAGNLYGTTNAGGDLNNGTVFKLTPNLDGTWTESVLYTFENRPDGNGPFGGLVFDQHGNLYGTTLHGGSIETDSGSVFKLSPNANGTWTESILYAFTGGTDGGEPRATLLLDSAGNLYGTAENSDAVGTVFTLTPNPDGTWSEHVIHNFTGGSDGGDLFSSLVFDSLGNIYGTTVAGGCGSSPCGSGVIFELTPNPDGTWTECVLHDFAGPDGAFPVAGLVFDRTGNLYGTTSFGGTGTSVQGVVFRLSRIRPADLRLEASTSPSPVHSHTFYSYTFNISNNGPDPSDWPRLVAQVPYGAVFHSYKMSAPGYCATPPVGSRGGVTCRYHGTQPVGTTWTVTLTVWAWSAPGTIITETAAPMAATHDPNWSNNVVTIIMPVQ